MCAAVSTTRNESKYWKNPAELLVGPTQVKVPGSEAALAVLHILPNSRVIV
jgi:hypothetical protein